MNFEDEARVKFLRLLGFSKDELERKVERFILCLLFVWTTMTTMMFIIDMTQRLVCVNVNYLRSTMFEDFKMPGEELPAQRARSGCQGFG